jgi:predicted acylesterase/phospholipase RssA
MTPEVKTKDDAGRKISGNFHIGLALSGGGFRASIFHLGVIRRLEELGIMKDIDTISAVSGGSIIAAYYACEMETRLRQVDPKLLQDTNTRVKIFEEIAEDFLKAVDHNLRTRALIFTPFFHPILFVKTIALKAFRSGARSELIQREYDNWFYDQDTIDQLPSVTPIQSKGSGAMIHGPQVILNTTSLLTGERVSFSREPNSGMTEMKRSNKNSIPLSRVVGASSGVPVLFPPTAIYGDLLVDGGVADNQGIEALLPAEQPPKQMPQQILLVSDASGQLEAKHTISTGEAKTFLRVNEILQFQVRSKLIDRLVQWKEDLPSKRFFAFTHLFLNLKDRGVTERLPAEIIPEVARIRTDLDQFSYIEQDSLMYHGYTLIDAQIKKYCLPLTTTYSISNTPKMTVPPLYNPGTLDTTEKRDRIRKELEAGAQKIFLLRSFKKYPRTVGLMLASWIAEWGSALYLLFGLFTKPLELTQLLIKSLLSGITSGWIGIAIDWLLFYAKLPIRTSMIDGTARLLSAGVLIAVAGYVLAFPTYWFVHRLVKSADRKSYHDLTGTYPTTRWKPLSKEEKASQSTKNV